MPRKKSEEEIERLKNVSLKRHIRCKKRILKDLQISDKIIDSISWDEFKSVVQIDNYCKKVINDYFDSRL